MHKEFKSILNNLNLLDVLLYYVLNLLLILLINTVLECLGRLYTGCLNYMYIFSSINMSRSPVLRHSSLARHF